MIPDVGTKQARELSKAINRELRHAEDGAAASASKIGNALGGIPNVIEKGLKKLGGVGGAVADVIFDFAVPLGEAAAGVGEVTSGMGAAGIAATATGVAVLGAAAAVAAVAVGAGVALAGMVALANGAIVAADRLEAAGHASRIPEGAVAALDQYQGSTARLWQEVDVLVVQLGSALAPALTVLSDLLGDAIEWVNNLDKSFDALRETVDGVIAMLPEWAKWPAAIDAVHGAIDSLEQGYVDLQSEAAKAKLAPTAEEIDRWRQLRLEREKLATEEAARQRKELTDAIAAEVAYNDTIAGLQTWLFDHQRDLDDAAWKLKRDLYADEVEAHEQAQSAMLAATVERRTAEQKLADEAKKKRDEELASVMTSLDKIAGATEDLASLVVSSYEERARAGEQLSEREQRAANTAFRVAQAAAIARIGISLAEAFAGLLASFSYLGPGAILAAAAEVAVAAAAIAPILGQSPPFPQPAGTGGGANAPTPTQPQTAVGVAPDGSGSNYKDPDNGGRQNPGMQRSAQGDASSVTVSVTFANGRVGKRRV